jgi:hypothetical protein
MGHQWFIWIAAAILLIVVSIIVQSRFRRETKRRSAEEELEKLRDGIASLEEQLASLPEGDPAYWDTQERLNELKASEWLILTEWVLIKGKKVEAYECPKCLGEGVDERSYICEFCKGAGIIRADRLYTREWTEWDEVERSDADQ